MKRCRTIYRSCRSQMFFKIGVLKKLANIHRSLFLTTSVAAFVSTRKEGRGKRGTKEQEKFVQIKEENKSISFNFYLQVLVLVITEMQKCK